MVVAVVVVVFVVVIDVPEAEQHVLHADTLRQQVRSSTIGSLAADVHRQQDPAAPSSWLHLYAFSHDERFVLSGQRPLYLGEREVHVPAENVLKQLPCPWPSSNKGESQVVLPQIVLYFVIVVVVVVVAITNVDGVVVVAVVIVTVGVLVHDTSRS